MQAFCIQLILCILQKYKKIKTDAGIKNRLQEWKKCCNFVAE